MLPGPVFNVELLTTARRARYYAARILYGVVLLLVIWQSYEGSINYGSRNSGKLSIGEMSRFAYNLFSSFAVAQSAAVLLLTPTLVAGVIADEKQRKTLHYLLASRLSSGEIVLGKLAARILHIVIYMLIGLPIVALLGLLGGIDPLIVWILDSATIATAFFLACLSILVSTYAKKVRDAIIGTYLIGVAWFAVPPIVEGLIRFEPVFKRFQPWVGPINDWPLAMNPIGLLMIVEGPRRGTTIWAPLAWFCGLQLAVGVFLLMISIWRLRPVYARSGGERSSRSWSMRFRARRARRRRPIGDDPMLWKERFVGRSGGFLRAVIRTVGALALLGIGYGAVRLGVPAYRELSEYGYGGSGIGWQSHVNSFGEFARVISTMLFVAWGLGVATSAASSITSEKEEDTWTSLTTSDLTGVEILGAKMIGAAWNLRPLAYAILALWLIGLPIGSIHPFGFLAGLVYLAIFTWYAAALGSYLSMRSRTTTRAMALSVVVLALTNVGYFLCCIPFRPNTPLVAAACTPFAMYTVQLSTADVWRLLGFEGGWSWESGGPREREMHAATLICGFLYLFAALGLTLASFSGFDRLLGRPRGPGGKSPPPEKPAAEDD